MQPRTLLSLLISCLFIWSGEGFANQARIALVIGNANYVKGELKTPLADLEQLTRKLESAGFEVLSQQNVSFYDLRILIEEFGNLAEESELALFFYAGHAIQLKTVSYLIPVDVNLRNRGDLQKLTWLDEVINEGSRAKNFIGILDTCRESRHAEGWGDRFGRAPVCGNNGGIARSLPDNSVVAFVNSVVGETQATTTPNGPSDYTSTLIAQIRPDLDVISVLENTQKEVRLLTGNQQNPVFYGQLESKVAVQAQLPESVSPELAPEPSPTPEGIDAQDDTTPIVADVDNDESALAQLAVAPSVITTSENTSADSSIISEEDRTFVLRKLVDVKNAIAAGDKELLLELLPPSADRSLFVQLLDHYEKIDIVLAGSSSSRNAGQISGVLRIREMFLANGDKVLPASAYKDTTLSSKRLEGGEWSRLE